MNQKLGAMPLLGGAATPSNTTSPAPRFTSVPSATLIHPAVCHNRHRPKLGGSAFFLAAGESWVAIEQKVAWAKAYLRYSVRSGILVHPAVCPQWILAENWGCGCAPLAERELSRSPSNTMLPRLRPTSVPSDILIHAAVWPQ